MFLFKKKQNSVKIVSEDRVTLDEWLKSNMNIPHDLYVFTRVEEKDTYKFTFRSLPSSIPLEDYLKYKDYIIDNCYVILRYGDTTEINMFLSDKIKDVKNERRKGND